MSLTLIVGVHAAIIPSCTLDREVYEQGDVGYVSLTVYNDETDVIRVTEVTARVDYFYITGTAFTQTFYTNVTLPVEILVNQSSTFLIPISLPTNIAPGYTQLFCRAKTDLWNSQARIWFQSDFPTSEPVLYIESPYKELYEQEQLANENLQTQLTQQQAINEDLQAQLDQHDNTIDQLEDQVQTLQTAYTNTTLIMYTLIAVTIALMIAITYLAKLLSKPRVLPNATPP